MATWRDSYLVKFKVSSVALLKSKIAAYRTLFEKEANVTVDGNVVETNGETAFLAPGRAYPIVKIGYKTVTVDINGTDFATIDVAENVHEATYYIEHK